VTEVQTVRRFRVEVDCRCNEKTAALHETFGEVPIIPSMAAYATDGLHMRRAGLPTYQVSGISCAMRTCLLTA
jgi:hypothetical protein